MQLEGVAKQLQAKKAIKNRYLHSPSHLLADELCKRFNDSKHFGFYLKLATQYNHDYLRSLAGQVLEGQNVKTPGKLFAYLIKKNNSAPKNESSNSKATS